jgi:DNA-binding NarL/FixJ family response regulator
VDAGCSFDGCLHGRDGRAPGDKRTIKARWPHIKIIILSMYGDYEAQALEAGADAFVNKGEPPARLLQALDAVAGQ